MMKHRIELGKQVKCKITGFKGTLTSITYFINGCIQAGVTPRVQKNNEFKESMDIDIEQLEVIGKKKIIKKSDNGGTQRFLKARKAF